jgi:membrane dipeptidase
VTPPSDDAFIDAPSLCCLGDSASRRAFLVSLLGVVAAACAGPTADGSAKREDQLMAQAAVILAQGPTIDLHAHPGFFTSGELPLAPLHQMQAAHVDAAFFSVVGDGPVIRREPRGLRNFRPPGAGELYQAALRQCARIRGRAQAGHLTLILEPGDIEAARHTHVPAALLAFEGGDALDGDPARVREFYALGMRSIQLMHYRVNELGDIQTEPAQHHRLTSAGEAIIAEMHRLGMIVDGAHAAPNTLRGMLDTSQTPIIVSHTGPAALRTNARHLSDALIRAVAAKGGVIGIWPLARRGEESLAQMLADIDYVRRLVGIDHVGIGTDMDGMSTFTVIPTYREFAPLSAALLSKGFSEVELHKLLGGNLMRVFEEVTSARG